MYKSTTEKNSNAVIITHTTVASRIFRRGFAGEGCEAADFPTKEGLPRMLLLSLLHQTLFHLQSNVKLTEANRLSTSSKEDFLNAETPRRWRKDTEKCDGYAGIAQFHHTSALLFSASLRLGVQSNPSGVLEEQKNEALALIMPGQTRITPSCVEPEFHRGN